MVGAGSAGFAAARRGVELGARVALVERGALGGTCVNVGCVPSKFLLRAAETHHRHRTTRFAACRPLGGELDWEALLEEKRFLVGRLRRERYERLLETTLSGVELVRGPARLVGPRTVEVDGAQLEAGAIVLATGARPVRPPIPGLDDPEVWDSTRALDAPAAPRTLAVLGGRFVALELGQAFARLGSRVTILQRSPRILPQEDPDVAEALAHALEAEGIEIRTGARVTRVERAARGFRVHLEDGAPVEAEAVLAVLGRRPATDGLGLEAVGVARAPDGAILVDETLETSVPGIFAAGDAIGAPAYVYAAAYEGGLAASNALGAARERRDYAGLPWVVFTDPQVAGVGLGQTEAAARGIPFETSRVELADVPRYAVAQDPRGFVKLLRDPRTDRLLGARIVAPEGGELVAEASLAIRFGIPVRALARHFHAYLTGCEAIKLAALGFEKDLATLSCCAA